MEVAERITLRLVMGDQESQHELHFLTKTTSCLKLLKRSFCERVGRPFYLMKFLFDGQLISDDHRPMDLKMKQDDLVEVSEWDIGASSWQAERTELHENLRSRIECPVCYEVPTSGPLPVCPNGHIICKQCNRTRCPVCRTRMTGGVSLLGSTVLESIDHKCPHEAWGCPAYPLPLQEMLRHKTECQFRPAKCQYDFLGCPAPLLPFKEMLRHNTECQFRPATTVWRCPVKSMHGELCNFYVTREEIEQYKAAVHLNKSHGVTVSKMKAAPPGTYKLKKIK